MADIKEFATSKVEEKKQEAQKRENKKTITAEEKRKYIAFSVIGLISLGFIFFAVNDFSRNDDKEQVQEIATPESESDKYNSKLEAIQQGEKQTNTRANNSMMDSFKESKEQNSEQSEATKKMQAELEKMNSDSEVNTSPPARKITPAPVRTVYIEREKTVLNSNKKVEKEKIQDDFGGFFSESEEVVSNKETTKGVSEFYAVIKGDHLGLKNKQRVALLLPKDVTINGKTFKKNTVVYALATFGSSRVNLTVNNINQVPMRIQAYDAQDGGLGLQVNESLVSETSSEMVAEGSNEIDLNGVPFGNTIKKLLTKKNKEHKIDLLNNQKMILKINK